MQERQSNEKLCLQLFKISYALFLTYSLIAHIPMFKTVLKIGTVIAIALFLVNFFLQYNRVERNLFWIYVALMLFSLVQSHFSNDYGLFKLILFAGSVRKLRFKDIIRFDMKLRIVLILTVMILCVAGIAPDVTVYYEGILRHSMGFTNPNTLGIAAFILVCDLIYVWDMRINFWHLLLVAGISVWLFYIARSRTAVYGILLTVGLALLYNWWPTLFSSKVGKYVLFGGMACFALFTLITTSAYMREAAWAFKLDDILTGRISRVAEFADLVKLKLFGQPIGETLSRSLDNTYAFVWYDLGLITFALFVFAYVRAQKLNYNVDMPLCVLLFVFALYGFSEHLWINVDYNIFMLAFCYTPKIGANEQLQDSEEKLSETPFFGRLNKRGGLH